MLMIEWLLIFQSWKPDDGVSIAQFGPFKTEAACIVAGQKVDKKLSSRNDWICVATDLPGKSGA
jgi:hypothetical protein